jgi:hypothetical protein
LKKPAIHSLSFFFFPKFIKVFCFVEKMYIILVSLIVLEKHYQLGGCLKGIYKFFSREKKLQWWLVNGGGLQRAWRKESLIE